MQNSNKPSSDAQSEGSNCNRECTTLSTELGEFVRELRLHWFEKSNQNWKRTSQFVFTFLGSLSFTIVFSFYTAATGIIQFQLEIFSTLGIFLIIPPIVTSLFLGVILSWSPRKTGPVRLFLSGVTLPSFILLLILLPLRIGGFIGDIPPLPLPSP